MIAEREIAMRWKAVGDFLNERGRRRWAGAEARALGHGGLAAVSRVTGLSVNTIKAGMREVGARSSRGRQLPAERSRRSGAGRPRVEQVHPGLSDALDKLVSPATRGDPMSPLLWTSKSTRQLAAALDKLGFAVTDRTVARILHEAGYSLQALRKTKEGTEEHPDRDAQLGAVPLCDRQNTTRFAGRGRSHMPQRRCRTRDIPRKSGHQPWQGWPNQHDFHHATELHPAQFRYIQRRIREQQKAGQPVVSIDCKKKELVGDFKNGGQEWQRKGKPEPVRVHDFLDSNLGKAIPYGVYDVLRNEGWVSVGIDHETAEFAASTLLRWWRQMGRRVYANAATLQIVADGGGSNGSRNRLWKYELQRVANQTGLVIRVSHLPPGTSKWNKIEHRMFCHITHNWRGRPLLSHQVVVNLIAATRTRQGLRIRAALDTKSYPTGIEVSNDDLASINLKPDRFHGEWNYAVSPARKT